MFRCLRWDFFLPRFVCEEAGLERVWVVLVVVVVVGGEGWGVGCSHLDSGKQPDQPLSPTAPAINKQSL